MASAFAEKMTTIYRKKVLWPNPPPCKEFVDEFERRGLILEYPEEGNWESYFPYSTALILTYEPEKPSPFYKNSFILRSLALKLADHGIITLTFVPDIPSIEVVRAQYKRIKLKPFLLAGIKTQIFDMAEIAARHNPGRAMNSTIAINCETPELAESIKDIDRFLLSRAFNDCKKLLLKKLDGGRSANVLCIHAVFEDDIEILAGGNALLSPLPFFAKIDVVGKIKAETNKYKEFTTHFVPFNMRPNIEEDRCINGSKRGILVGNFVEKSESMLHVSRRGHSQGAIYSLFDIALRGWRLQSKTETGNICTACKIFINTKNIEQRVLRLGIVVAKSPQELLAIVQVLPDQEYCWGPIHGDLHAKNIMVRNSDSILIDFNSTRFGPLVCDPASLEVSLAFDVGDDLDFDEWRQTVDELYEPKWLEATPPPSRNDTKDEWLRTCVRQIRLIALAEEASPHEYCIVVALYLLRKAMFSYDSLTDDKRRGHAFILAHKIILHLQDKLTPT